MLAYRHQFHAGAFADVFKHALLAQLVLALEKKDKPFLYLDTHAGIGLYDLMHEWAQKNAEYKEGIELVWARKNAPPEMTPYLDAVRVLRAHGVEIRRHFRRCILARPDEFNALLVLGIFLRPLVHQVVEPNPGMGVEVEERFVLLFEREHELREQRVLEHVGKSTGVKLMAVGEHAESRIEESGLSMITARTAVSSSGRRHVRPITC